MVDPIKVKAQLKQLGMDNSFWGRPELDELPKILIDDEVIEHVINGHYEGGFATLCATNHRLLLVDKKMFFLTVEDIRYDMIAEVDYGHQFIGATIHIRSFSKDLKFQSFKKPALRDFTHYIQHRVMVLRGHQTGQHGQAHNQQFQDYQRPQPIVELTNAQSTVAQEIVIAQELSDQQTNSLLPLSAEVWHKVRSGRKLVNPYAQTPLVTRRRVGRFQFAEK